MFSVESLLKNLISLPSKRFFFQSRQSQMRRKNGRAMLHSAGIEVLEDRVLLTGAVQAAMIGGELVVEGGSGEDHVAIHIQDGNLVVQGFNGTTINGGDSFLAVAGDSTLDGDLRVHLGVGNDTFLIGPGIEVEDDASIDLGPGNNAINIEEFSVGDDFTIRTGSGNDTIFLSDVSVGDDLRIFSGAGNDSIRVTNNDVRDNLLIGTAEGDDTVAVIGSSIGDHGALVSGRGNDTLGSAGNSPGSRFVRNGGTGQNSNLNTITAIDNLAAFTAGENLISGLINPSAIDDTYEIDENTNVLTISADQGLLSNDLMSVLKNPLSSTVEKTEAANGSVDINPDGSFVYTPNANFEGIDTFTYTLIDSAGGTDEGTVEITVGLNIPTVVDDAYVLTVDKNTLVVDAADGLLANDSSSLQNDVLIADPLTDPDHGNVVINDDGSFEYTPDPGFSGDDEFTYIVSHNVRGTAVGTVKITVDPVNFTIDISSNDTVDGNGTLITKNELFHVEGVTLPDAKIDIDTNGDGDFDDAADINLVADGNGQYSFDHTLTHNDSNQGANLLKFRFSASSSDRFTIEDLNVHLAIGTVVQFNVNVGNTARSYEIELLDDDAPIAVANFLNYVESNRYDNSIIHRSVEVNGTDSFIDVIQGGGFTLNTSDLPQIQPVSVDAPIAGEFIDENSNLRGTLSMALSNGEDTGTSQWFINVESNTGLDSFRHTVFGRVIGAGMDVVEAIHDLDVFSLVNTFGQGALATVPLDDFSVALTELTGSVSIAAGSNVVTGTGTSFLSEIQGPGSEILIDGNFVVASVVSDTQLIITENHTTGVTNREASVRTPPREDQYVLFTDISKILEP